MDNNIIDGKVYIATMNFRGKWAQRPSNSRVLNVTSAQAKTSLDRLTFSPMTEYLGGYKNFWCFENYWQSGKVHHGLDHQVTKDWWKKQNQGKRRYPGGKGKRVLYADFGDGKQLGYVESRKQIYVPEYYQLIEKSSRLQEWKDIVNGDEETRVVVYDFDGPRDEEGNPECVPVNLKLLINKINDPRHPFGHGYVVAAALLGITPLDYI